MKPFANACGVLTLLALGPSILAAQEKRPLEHEDVDRWARIAQPALSPDGSALTYGLTWLDGDPRAIVRTLDDGVDIVLSRATAPRFSADGLFVIATIKPSESILDSLRAEGKTSDDLPGDTLAYASVTSLRAEGEGALMRLGPLKSFAIGEDGGEWLVVHLDPPEDDSAPDDSAGNGSTGDQSGDAETKDAGESAPLLLRHMASSEQILVEHVTSYRLSDDGSVVLYAVSGSDGEPAMVQSRTLGREGASTVASGHDTYTELATSPDGRGLAFLAGTREGDDDAEDDDEDQTTSYGLMAGWDGESARLVAEGGTTGLPAGWLISASSTPRFSEDAERLFFATAPAPFESTLEDVPEDDQVSVDVWNWKDPLLQPMQLVQRDDEEKRDYQAIYHRDGNRVVQLATLQLPDVMGTDEGESSFALGRSGLDYRQEVSWDGSYRDAYSINLESGEATLLERRIKGAGASLSPEGDYAVWWDGEEEAWYVADMASGEVKELSKGIPTPLYNELDDHPQAPPAYGPALWMEGDAGVLLADKHDIWLADPRGRNAPINITDGVGRETGMRFRVVRTDGEAAVPEGDILLSAFHLIDKTAGFYRDRLGSSGRPSRLVMDDYSYSNPIASEDGKVVLYTRQSFIDFPDLWTADEDLRNSKQVSDVNTQQSEYTWGTSEIVEWTSTDGIPLQGILYKPDGFDRGQEHPMMVYFYERNSDGIHRYKTPAPGSSSVNISFYVSRGYLLFVPDIPYEIGYPGESALDAVVPGVLSLVEQGFVDRARIGVQGHSWGGYQIAYMITKTNLFAVAEAGAPVSNMTSAYGGIRWGTGMSRMFQYEHTQSRIGGTLWESTNEYLHNSPLFYADKIQTPLLMMHNDEDGAVPWYQGIEMFVAMRRLDKPVWMLNYNGEAHGLRQEHNRRDWAIRMQQFFDHYLLDAPAPVWLEDGVPAVLKGKTLGLELKTADKPISEDP